MVGFSGSKTPIDLVMFFLSLKIKTGSPMYLYSKVHVPGRMLFLLLRSIYIWAILFLCLKITLISYMFCLLLKSTYISVYVSLLQIALSRSYAASSLEIDIYEYFQFSGPKSVKGQHMVCAFGPRIYIISTSLFLCSKVHPKNLMFCFLSKPLHECLCFSGSKSVCDHPWCASSVPEYISNRYLCLFAQVYPRRRTCFISSQSCHTTAYVSLVQKRDTRHKWCASYPKIEIKSVFLFPCSKPPDDVPWPLLRRLLSNKRFCLSASNGQCYDTCFVLFLANIELAFLWLFSKQT